MRKGQFKLELQEGFFTQRLEDAWNMLSEAVVVAAMMTTFKIYLDRPLSKRGIIGGRRHNKLQMLES